MKTNKQMIWGIEFEDPEALRERARRAEKECDLANDIADWFVAITAFVVVVVVIANLVV